MILTDAQIEAETRTLWGGKQNHTNQIVLGKSLDSFERFVFEAMALFPEMRPYIDRYKAAPITAKKFIDDLPCCHHDHTTHSADKVAGFNPQKISSLERQFRNRFGKELAVDLLNIGARWQLEAMRDATVGSTGGYWSTAYYVTLSDTFQSAYTELMSPSIWDQLKKRAARQNIDLVPPMPLIVTDGQEFIEDIYTNGYTRVTSKITQLHIPRVQQIMTEGLSGGLNWDQIAAQMHEQLGADAYHWTRLVRSEMINASQEAKINQALESDDVNVIWRASRVGACPVCAQRNGKIFDPRKMGDAAYFATDETGKIDTKKEIKIGRYPHPNCRCTMAFTVLDANWNE